MPDLNKMKRCHECDSEISEMDAFCPFCGISIQPSITVEPEPEPIIESSADELESTIMMSPADAGLIIGTEPPIVDEVSIDQPYASEPTPEIAETIEEETSVEDISTFDVDNAPMPSILSDFTSADDLRPIESTPFNESSEEMTPAQVFEEIQTVNAEDVSVIDEPVQNEEQLNDNVEIADVNEDPVIVGVVNDQVEEQNDNSVSSFPETTNPEKTEPEQETPSPFAIEMPEEQLDEHDPFKFGATFDSVRIMENQIPEYMDEADTKIPSQANVVETELPAEEIPPVAEEAVVNTTGSTSVTTGDSDNDGRKVAKLKPLQEGTVLNSRYEVVRKIGGGGMGAVYLASDNNLGGVLRAVKEMVQAHIEEEQQEKAINDFKRESMILSTLDHVGIPTIFDYFYDAEEGRFYLVMKYISGGDLSSRLRSTAEGKLDEKTVVDWAIQIADVLDYLHSQPSTIVYRDLKPSNIMVDGNTGRVMIIDFGIARSINQKEEKGVTAVGTMGYAPPELFSGNVEPRSDIYSLGSTMFHLLTGADPQSNPLLIFDFQKNPRPRQINPRLSDQIEQILMKSVEYNADSRFKSASELKRILETHLNNLNSGNVTYGVSEAPAAVSLENQFVFCGFCGQRIVATDLFCAFCGSKQPLAQQGVNAEIYSRSSATARLFVEGTGELSTPTFSLIKDENLVGRRDPMSNIFPEVDLSKYDPQTKISRRHARIWRNGMTFLVEDLGSSNGTIVELSTNEALRLTPHKPHPLANGDKIRVGDTTLHFVEG